MTTIKDDRATEQIVLDVLQLVDGYLAAQPPDRLISDGRGVATWAELRQHVAGATQLLARAHDHRISEAVRRGR